MSFTRKKTYLKKNGEVSVYYSRVENQWENGTCHQKHLQYLGKSLNLREIPVDPALAGQLAQALMSGVSSPEEIKKVLKQLGVPIVGRLKRISLVYTPPLRKLTLRIE
jgi:hypothetical protein